MREVAPGCRISQPWTREELCPIRVASRSSSDDNWWIKDLIDGAEDAQGFNRLLQDDYGCRRHEGKANYVFADGHTGRYNANDIRCDVGECWWSLRLDAHARRVAAAFPSGHGVP